MSPFYLLYLACVYFLQTNASNTASPATKLTAFKYRDGGRDTAWIHSVKKCYPGKRLAIVHAFFFLTTPFYICDHFDMRKKILCNIPACCKVKNAPPPPLPPRRPFLENGRLTRANVTLFLSTQVWSRTHYRHNLPAGSLSAECVPVLPPTQKKNKHLEAWGSECKCEYIHPHAALLNLWA